MKIDNLEVEFEYSSETKNNYTFVQKKDGGIPKMFPPKIYLNKDLFNNRDPKGVVIFFKTM